MIRDKATAPNDKPPLSCDIGARVTGAASESLLRDNVKRAGA
jgi:hypothetical protein